MTERPPGAPPVSPASTGRAWDQRFVAFTLAILLLLVYLANGQASWCPDCAPNAFLPIELVERGSFYLDDYTARTGEKLNHAFAERDGHVLSKYAVLSGVLALPLHVVARALGADAGRLWRTLAKVTAAISTALFGAFLFLVLERTGFRRETALLTTLAVALGTTAYSVASQALWQHGPSLLFLTAAAYFLVSERRGELFLAGLALGLAVFNRPANGVFAATLGLYVLLERRRGIIAFAVGAIGPLLLMAWYSSVYWGSVLALGQAHQVGKVVDTRHVGFDTPIAESLPALLFSPNRGLFVYSPFLLLALPGLALMTRRRPRPIAPFLAAGALLHLALYTRWSVWWGGWCWGYRMLTELLPALAFALALAWERWIRPAPALLAAFAGLLAVSIYLQFLGASYSPLNDWNEDVAIDQHPERVWSLEDTQIGRAHRRFVGSWVARRAPHDS